MELKPDDIFKLRQEKSKLILERFKEWLDELVNQSPSKSPLGHAIAYTLTNWGSLNIYLTNDYLLVDNNYVENKSDHLL